MLNHPQTEITVTLFWAFIFAALLSVCIINTGCGSYAAQVESDNDKETKRLYCGDLIDAADKAKAQGKEISVAEQAAVDYCEGE